MIVPLAAAHAGEVARIHVECLPRDFLTALGPRFLAGAFYRELLSADLGFGYGWLDGQRLVGYVSGTYDAGRFSRRAVRGHLPALLSALLLGLVARPMVLARALQVGGYLLRAPGRPAGPQIRANGVLQAYRGRGIGRRLYVEALRHLHGRNFESCTVMVSADDSPVNRLWRDLGGVVERTFSLTGERRHLYRIDLRTVSPSWSATSARSR